MHQVRAIVSAPTTGVHRSVHRSRDRETGVHATIPQMETKDRDMSRRVNRAPVPTPTEWQRVEGPITQATHVRREAALKRAAHILVEACIRIEQKRLDGEDRNS